MFMNSKEGKNYYLGILPQQNENDKPIRITKSNATRKTKDSFTNASTRRSSLERKKKKDEMLEENNSQDEQEEAE